MILQELLRNATQKDLGNISKAKKKYKKSPRRTKKAKKIKMSLP